MLIWLFSSSFKDKNSTQQNHDVNIYEGVWLIKLC